MDIETISINNVKHPLAISLTYLNDKGNLKPISTLLLNLIIN